jgi:hypothetical protein
MAKVRQIYIWDGNQNLGPLRRDELVQQLRVGIVLPSHFYWEEGMSDWARVASLPCCARFLASDAQKDMLSSMGVEYDEFLTKDDVSRILEAQPATDRQLALMNYLGLTISPNLTKNEASELLDKAKQDPLIRERLERWNVDRLELHSALYAAERRSFKESRSELLLRRYREFRSDMRESGVSIKNLTLEQINSLIVVLDRTRPRWDSDIELNGLDYLLELLKDSD